MTKKLLAYRDDGPDELGRRRFALHWHDGHRCRGQVFYAVPPSDVVEATEAEAAPCDPCYRGEPGCEKRGP